MFIGSTQKLVGVFEKCMKKKLKSKLGKLKQSKWATSIIVKLQFDAISIRLHEGGKNPGADSR